MITLPAPPNIIETFDSEISDPTDDIIVLLPKSSPKIWLSLDPKTKELLLSILLLVPNAIELIPSTTFRAIKLPFSS